jgi:nucleotide-binding universal stress UspA family protein
MPQFTEMRLPPIWAPVEPASAARTVVVGYDGSDASRRALRRAAELARAGGHVAVVTATHQPTPLEADAPLDEALHLLAEAATYLDREDVRVSTRIDEREPVEALVEVARRLEADVIVVGARGDDYISRALRGSVGQRLVTRAPCDLLVVG